MISHSKQGPSGVEKKDKSAAQTTQVKERLNSEAVEMGKLDVKEVWFAGWHTGNLFIILCCLITDQRRNSNDLQMSEAVLYPTT